MHQAILTFCSHNFSATRLRRALIIAILSFFAPGLSSVAIAAPEEIQVYLDEFADVGKYGLDLHTNYVLSGHPPNYHQLRVTPELSYGVSDNWEFGGYLLTASSPNELAQTDGIKLRAKWRPHAPDTHFYWAVNFEVAQLSERFYPDTSSGEIKLIGVWKTGSWILVADYDVDRSLKTAPVQGATSELDTKVAYQAREGMQVGVESYVFFGSMHNDPIRQQGNQTNYLAADFSLSAWSFNIGIGHGSNSAPDHTIIKAIISVPLY